MAWRIFTTRMQTDPAEIKPYLYLGSARAANDEVLLRERGISHILNAAIELPNALEPHFTYLHLELDDDQGVNIIDSMDKCCEFIEQCRSIGGKVLVHCQAGISRSATLVIAYLMKVDNMSLRDAFFYVKDRRSQAGPNLGFFRQLTEWEVRLGKAVSFEVEEYYVVKLVSMGFDESPARKAVADCNGRLETAIGLLLSGQYK